MASFFVQLLSVSFAWNYFFSYLINTSFLPCSGNPKEEPGAVVCRMAQSFVRIGSFQIHAARKEEDLEIIRKLADYVIRHHFPQFENLSAELQTGSENIKIIPEKNKYLGIVTFSLLLLNQTVIYNFCNASAWFF